jgi:hypothetical protein
MGIPGKNQSSQWIGLRENFTRKPWFLPSNIGVSCILRWEFLAQKSQSPGENPNHNKLGAKSGKKLWKNLGKSGKILEKLWKNLERMVKRKYWLVVQPYPSEKYEFVSWDDEIPNIWKKNHVPNNQPDIKNVPINGLV